MDTIFESKNEINNHLQKIFSTASDSFQDELKQRNILECKIKELTSLTQRMNTEISEKDKLLSLHEKKMHDYEIMINKIQEKALQEQNEKEKFSILRSQDKEINDKNKKIDFLEKKVNSLMEEKINLQNELSCVQGTVNDKQELSSEDNDKQESSSEDNDKQESSSEDNDKQESSSEDNDKQESSSGDNDKQELSSEDEEGVDVKTIKYRKKEYYIIVGETPQYIYTIDDDGDIGKKVGEVIHNKKTFYAIDSKK